MSKRSTIVYLLTQDKRPIYLELIKASNKNSKLLFKDSKKNSKVLFVVHISHAPLHYVDGGFYGD